MRTTSRETRHRNASSKKSECAMRDASGNISGNGISLSILRITVCWRRIFAAASKRVRTLTLPTGRVSAIPHHFSLRRLPVAHRGWVHPTRQLLHAGRLRLCQGPHNAVAGGDVVADRGQALQDRLPLFPVELPQERPQPLDERIFQKSFAIRFRDEEAVQ